MGKFKTLLLTLVLFLAVAISTSSAKKSDTPSTEKNPKQALLAPKTDKQSVQRAHLYTQRKLALSGALKAYFKKAIARGEIIGAGVSVVKGDSIVFSGGFGLKNINRQDLVNDSTVFRLGSLSKGFAGVLADIVVHDGELTWGDKVSDFVPEFALADSAATDQITLSEILSQSSGVPYHSYTNLVESGMPLSDIAKRFSNIKLIAEPGKQYSYQNAVFALSGEMIGKATGETVQQALKEKIFVPLGMSTASTDHESIMATHNFATPHSKWASGWHAQAINNKYYNAVAAGGVNASAEDMAKWMRFLLGHNPEVLDAGALAKVFEPIIEIKGHHKYYQKWKGHVASYYGLGWRIHQYDDPTTGALSTMMHHGGTVSDYRTEIALFPQEDMGVTILFNCPTSLAQTVVPDLHKIIQEVMSAPLQSRDGATVGRNAEKTVPVTEGKTSTNFS